MSRTGLFLIGAGVLSVIALIVGAPQISHATKSEQGCVKVSGALLQLETPMRFSSPADARTFPETRELTWRNALTVEGWINVDDSSRSWRRIAGKQFDGSATDSSWVFGLGSRGGLYFGLFHDGAQIFIDGNRALTPGEWHHVAATWDGSMMTTWLDGDLDQRVAFSGNVQRSSQPLRIGAGNTSEYPLEGRIDRLGLYDRALTLNELTSIANAGRCH